MSHKLTVTVALAAGFIGGSLSSLLRPLPANAQAPPAFPKVVAAQNFVLVDERGVKLGEMTVDRDGKPNIRLFDTSPPVNPSVASEHGGTVIWSARGEHFRPLQSR
jgi:hypothetical protein